MWSAEQWRAECGEQSRPLILLPMSDLYFYISRFNFRRRFPSPLKRLQAAGSFDEQIKNILRKDHNTPLIKFVFLFISIFTSID